MAQSPVHQGVSGFPNSGGVSPSKEIRSGSGSSTPQEEKSPIHNSDSEHVKSPLSSSTPPGPLPLSSSASACSPSRFSPTSDLPPPPPVRKKDREVYFCDKCGYVGYGGPEHPGKGCRYLAVLLPPPKS